MIDTINRALERADKNPLLAIAWALFMSTFLYWWGQEQAFGQKRAELRQVAVQMEATQNEIKLADEMIELWHTTLNDMARRHLEYQASINVETLRPEQFPPTLTAFIAEANERRSDLSVAIARINNMYFEQSSLQQLKATLSSDIVERDKSLLHQIEFFDAMLHDFDEARRMAPHFRDRIEDDRKDREGAQRQILIDQTFERARKTLNANVQAFNERRATLLRELSLDVVAMTYMGAFIGGLGGWFFRKWRLTHFGKLYKPRNR